MEYQSNLTNLINEAIENCWAYGSGEVGETETEDGLVVRADWVDSKNPGYSVIQVNLYQNGIIKFSYDDYGTETEQ